MIFRFCAPALSPYNYTANNPIWYVDPDGKIIKIHYIDERGRNQYYTYTPGIKPTVANEFVQKVHEAVSYAMGNDNTNVFQQLSSNSRTLTIKQNNNTKPLPDPTIQPVNSERHSIGVNTIRYGDGRVVESLGSVSSNIEWNPALGLKTTNGGGQAPSTVLFHEALHALKTLSVRTVAEARQLIADRQIDNITYKDYDDKEHSEIIPGAEANYINATNNNNVTKLVFLLNPKTNTMENHLPQTQRTRINHRGDFYPTVGVNSISPSDGKSISGVARPLSSLPGFQSLKPITIGKFNIDIR